MGLRLVLRVSILGLSLGLVFRVRVLSGFEFKEFGFKITIKVRN